ncbi:MAG TPA: hypothetical protein VN721_11995 [Flavipsychrobacter sp.]|nr:hypothetical protein [Flavipsychrobacter sp.]
MKAEISLTALLYCSLLILPSKSSFAKEGSSIIQQQGAHYIDLKFHAFNKHNNQLQLLYDIWWQQEGLRTPIFLRFATMTK